MNALHLTISAAIYLAASSGIMAAAPSGSGQGIQFLPRELKAPVANAQTDESLKKRQAAGKFGGFAPEGTERKGWDLMENSEFIAFNGGSTLLPKGSILHIPEKFRPNVVPKPTGKLVIWTEFAGLYRGLVTCFNVTLAQAAGQAPIDEARLETARKTGLIVVAMLDGNPVSVSPRASQPVASSH